MSQHFSLAEATFSSVATRACITNEPDEVQLMNIYDAMDCMEKVRAVLHHPVQVDSWLRTPELNRLIGGSNSPRGHVSGWCIDFTCPGFGTPKEVCQKIIDEGIEFDQLIHEGSWVHISFHPAMRREVLTAHFKPNRRTEYTRGL